MEIEPKVTITVELTFSLKRFTEWEIRRAIEQTLEGFTNTNQEPFTFCDEDGNVDGPLLDGFYVIPNPRLEK